MTRNFLPLLVLLSFPSTVLLAECLGCPASSLEVTIHLKSGVVDRGLLQIHGSLVPSIIDTRPLSLQAASVAWPDDELDLWKRSVVAHQVFAGSTFLLRRRQGDELSRLEEDRFFELPLLVYGEPTRYSLSEIEWIEDRSILEGHWEFLGFPYYVSESTAHLVLGNPKSAVWIDDRRDTEDGAIFGVSFVKPIDEWQLARKCIENADWNKVWVRDGVVCFNWAGTT